LEDLGIFYGNLVCSTTIWNIMWPFGILYGYLVCFFPFWYVVPRKIWQPWFKSAQGRKARPKRIQKVFFSKRFYSKICARSRTILGLLSWYCPLFDCIDCRRFIKKFVTLILLSCSECRDMNLCFGLAGFEHG
jgi:hypothetical protein